MFRPNGKDEELLASFWSSANWAKCCAWSGVSRGSRNNLVIYGWTWPLIPSSTRTANHQFRQIPHFQRPVRGEHWRGHRVTMRSAPSHSPSACFSRASRGGTPFKRRMTANETIAAALSAGWLGDLAQPGRPQHGLLWATTCATVLEFVVDHHGRHRADAKFLGPSCHGGLIHIQNTDLA